MACIFQKVVIFVLIPTIFTETPVFSENYAKIRYQPRENWNSHKAELNLDGRHREEVTENPPPTNTQSPQTITDNKFSESYDITTESESEQINLARFAYKNIVKDKLVDDSENETNNKFDGRNLTGVVQEETNDEDTIIGNIIVEDDEALDDLDQSEINNLNEQGVYYIYHPHMLLQKVVYITREDPNNMKFSTQINVENVKPIVEPIYTYDARTFVLQRLILRPQEES